jgi:DNA-binding NtrC family response regulator
MKPTIVCVDDEKIILDSLKVQLKAAFGTSYSYELAESGVDALEIIDELEECGKVVVIISDWLMPDMKGDELLIKVHEKFPQIIKLMLTGQADEAAITRAINEANLYKCLKKPWSKDELVISIRNATAAKDDAIHSVFASRHTDFISK